MNNILVVGDLMLDCTITGSVNRISPEAPVQVVKTESSEFSLGGAGNVIRNLLSLDMNVFVSSIVDNSMIGGMIIDEMKSEDIETEGIFRKPNKISSMKTRVLSSSGQQLLRIDNETTDDISRIDEKKIVSYISEIIKNVDCIILSDYNKGVLTKNLVQSIILTAKKHNVPVIVDPKGDNPSKYLGATVITPNKKEALELTGETDIQKAAAKLKRISDNVIVTLGSEGVLVFENEKEPLWLETEAKEVYDVSGAGDTFVAMFATCYVNNFSFEGSVNFANKAAGIVVGKRGVATLTMKELIRFYNNVKLVTNIEDFIEEEKKLGKKIVFTNGCFDLFHAGHAMYLKDAKEFGDILVVGLNSDESISRIKGKNRPIMDEKQRTAVLSALECVDYISIFNEDTPIDLIKRVRPDVIVKASDYKPEEVVGKDFVESYGGEVKIIKIKYNVSTTDIISKVKKCQK